MESDMYPNMYNLLYDANQSVTHDYAKRSDFGWGCYFRMEVLVSEHCPVNQMSMYMYLLLHYIFT